MTSIEKLIKKFSIKPDSMHLRDLERILNYLGFKLVGVRGSHKKFKHHKAKDDLVIPVHGNDCEKFYKKKTYKLLKSNKIL